MELTISDQSYKTSPDALVRAIRRARTIASRAVAEEYELDGAVTFCDPKRPAIHLANHACEIETADPPNLFDELEDHYRQLGTPCLRLDASGVAWPDPLAECAQTAGFVAREKVVLSMRQYQPPSRCNQELQIIPARAAYPQLRLLYQRMAQSEHRAEPDNQLSRDLVNTLVDRLDESRIELFLGRIDGHPVGIAGVTALGNIGVIDAAYTVPEYRGQAIAATLLAHTIDHSHRARFEHVILERTKACYAIPFYELLGFEQVTSYIRFVRQYPRH